MLVTDTTKLELDGTMKKRQGGKKCRSFHDLLCREFNVACRRSIFVTLVGNRLYTSGSIISVGKRRYKTAPLESMN